VREISYDFRLTEVKWRQSLYSSKRPRDASNRKKISILDLHVISDFSRHLSQSDTFVKTKSVIGFFYCLIDKSISS
jgi:hypothetical protein